MLVSELFLNVRDELTDEISSRWSDAALLRLLKRTYRRTVHIMRRNGIELAKGIYEFSTAVGQSDYSLPMDFLAPIVLVRTDIKAHLIHRIIEQWEEIYDASECTNWIIKQPYLYIMGTPQTAIDMKLYYWVNPDIDGLSVTDDTLWEGLVDDLLIEYLSLRCQNIDEMNLDQNVKLLQDFEQAVLDTLKTIDPTVVNTRGWMGDMDVNS